MANKKKNIKPIVIDSQNLKKGEELKPVEIEAKEYKKKKSKKGILIIFIITLLLDLLGITGYVLAYGPWSYLRELLITTSMTTLRHKYIAKTFYDDEAINYALANNVVIESGESTDVSQITFINNFSKIYESEYERQILEHDENEDYKVIDINGGTYKGYLVVLYDASRVRLAVSSGLGRYGQYITTLARNNNALIAMNGGGFIDPNLSSDGGEASGYIIKDGRVIYKGRGGGLVSGIIGFTNDNVLVLTHDSAEEAIAKGLRDGMEFGPFLIVNGEASYIRGNGGWGIASRSVIAQRKDGIVLFLVIDGRSTSVGADLVEVTRVLQRYGAYNAANLDGGASSGLVIDGKIRNKPCALSATGERGVPNAWIYTRR